MVMTSILIQIKKKLNIGSYHPKIIHLPTHNLQNLSILLEEPRKAIKISYHILLSQAMRSYPLLYMISFRTHTLKLLYVPKYGCPNDSCLSLHHILHFLHVSSTLSWASQFSFGKMWKQRMFCSRHKGCASVRAVNPMQN